MTCTSGLLGGLSHPPSFSSMVFSKVACTHQREALVQTLLAARAAAVFDCSLIMRQLWNVSVGDSLRIIGRAICQAFGVSLLLSLLRALRLCGIPSHDKKPLWMPALDWNLSASFCRHLNAADLAAAQLTESRRQGFLRHQRCFTAAHRWANEVFRKQLLTTSPFHEVVVGFQRGKEQHRARLD